MMRKSAAATLASFAPRPKGPAVLTGHEAIVARAIELKASTDRDAAELKALQTRLRDLATAELDLAPGTKTVKFSSPAGEISVTRKDLFSALTDEQASAVRGLLGDVPAVETTTKVEFTGSAAALRAGLAAAGIEDHWTVEVQTHRFAEGVRELVANLPDKLRGTMRQILATVGQAPAVTIPRTTAAAGAAETQAPAMLRAV